jgi:hypothetical protein
VELEPEERDLLLLIYDADCSGAVGGHDDRALRLMFTGGMLAV